MERGEERRVLFYVGEEIVSIENDNDAHNEPNAENSTSYCSVNNVRVEKQCCFDK